MRDCNRVLHLSIFVAGEQQKRAKRHGVPNRPKKKSKQQREEKEQQRKRPTTYQSSSVSSALVFPAAAASMMAVCPEVALLVWASMAVVVSVSRRSDSDCVWIDDHNKALRCSPFRLRFLALDIWVVRRAKKGLKAGLRI